jgi:1,4-dihydroxy-6-naphthoate synthase
LAFAWQHYPQLSPYVIQHAQEMSEEVMRKHIELYVNDYTAALDEEAFRAIGLMQQMW